MVDKSKRGIVGLVLIFLIVIGDLIVAFADSPSKPNTFTKTVADTLYCAVGPSTNCASTYCAVNDQGLLYNCSALNAGQYCEIDGGCAASGAGGMMHLAVTKTSLTSISSTTYSTVLTANTWIVTPANNSPAANDQLICWSDLNYAVNVLAGAGSFRLRDSTNGQVSAPFDVNPGVASDNFTVGLGWKFTVNGLDTIVVEARVTIGTTTLTVGDGYLFCEDITPPLQGYSVT